MQVFVLTGEIQYEGATVLGVYMTRNTAETALIKFQEEVTYQYDTYYVHEVTVDAMAKHHDGGIELEVD